MVWYDSLQFMTVSSLIMEYAENGDMYTEIVSY